MGTTEDEMVGWHHQLDAHEFEQALGVGNGQGSLACRSPWGRKELDMTEWLSWTEQRVGHDWADVTHSQSKCQEKIQISHWIQSSKVRSPFQCSLSVSAYNGYTWMRWAHDNACLLVLNRIHLPSFIFPSPFTQQQISNNWFPGKKALFGRVCQFLGCKYTPCKTTANFKPPTWWFWR